MKALRWILIILVAYVAVDIAYQGPVVRKGAVTGLWALECVLYFLLWQEMKKRSRSVWVVCLTLGLPILIGLGVWVVSKAIGLGALFALPVVIWMGDVVLALHQEPGH